MDRTSDLLVTSRPPEPHAAPCETKPSAGRWQVLIIKEGPVRRPLWV